MKGGLSVHVLQNNNYVLIRAPVLASNTPHSHAELVEEVKMPVEPLRVVAIVRVAPLHGTAGRDEGDEEHWRCSVLRGPPQWHSGIRGEACVWLQSPCIV